ncbi:MAG TPA: DNA-3-methyladenine glycosylase [Bacteroidia bacterium]|jgi:DNA-3-methyladenine glycosylase|nr:DNA-3-methyladenine glycosylase [Bacteroidia bacterium]
MKLQKDFYIREDVVLIAKELLGKVLITNFNGAISAGIITETEAYAGINDRASHAFGGRRTARTETMYATGGTAYVYLCYGIHHLFNVVTNQKDIPHAVLIRAIKPIEGMDVILKRRKQKEISNKLSSGPGTLSQALGIQTSHSGENLLGNKIWIEDRGINFSDKEIIKSPRIGVDYAGADALLPYRFFVNF